MSGDTGSTTTSTLTTMGAGDTNVRYVIFSGKQGDWENWKEKFMIKAGIRGYDGVLLGDETVPPTHDKEGKKLTLKPDQNTIIETNKVK